MRGLGRFSSFFHQNYFYNLLFLCLCHQETQKSNDNIKHRNKKSNKHHTQKHKHPPTTQFTPLLPSTLFYFLLLLYHISIHAKIQPCFHPLCEDETMANPFSDTPFSNFLFLWFQFLVWTTANFTFFSLLLFYHPFSYDRYFRFAFSYFFFLFYRLDWACESNYKGMDIQGSSWTWKELQLYFGICGGSLLFALNIF